MLQKTSTAQQLYDLAVQAMKTKHPDPLHLQEELLKLQARQEEILRELQTANVRLERLRDYKPADTGINYCPVCWIDGEPVELYGIPFDSKDNLSSAPGAHTSSGLSGSSWPLMRASGFQTETRPAWPIGSVPR
jgi:hypothetical protein